MIIWFLIYWAICALITLDMMSDEKMPYEELLFLIIFSFVIIPTTFVDTVIWFINEDIDK